MTLPHGVAVEGRWRRDASVRALTGYEEELLGRQYGRSRAARVTELLTRCVERLGGRPPREADVRSLVVGDREALLLHVRRATLGDRIDCVLTCPEAPCGARLDVTLGTDELLLPPYPDPSDGHVAEFDARGGGTVRFRLPTGADQEAVADRAAVDPPSAARSLLGRCVTHGVEEGPPDLDRVAGPLAARMAELDPQAELRITATCAECGSPLEALLDAAAYFFAEVEAAQPRLYEEVHTLAVWYHWSEASILGLSLPRRRRYLELIAARSAGPAAWSAA